VDVVVAGVAVLAFAATVLVLAGAGRRLQRSPARTVMEPFGDEWLTVGQVATLLEVPEDDVVGLVERDAIPFYVIAGGSRTRPADYRFRRDEIDAWTIG
jgi:excisionase family DNA binding protein